MAEPTKAELEQELAELRAQKAELESQLAAQAAAPVVDPRRPWPADKIITRSQLEVLAPEQQQAFRTANGTVIEDPVAE